MHLMKPNCSNNSKFMATKYTDGKSLSLNHNPVQCQVCLTGITTTLGDYISNNIQTTNPHHTKCMHHIPT